MKSRLELEPKSNLQPLFEIVKPVLCVTSLLLIILAYVGLLYGSLCSESAAEHRVESGGDANLTAEAVTA